VGVGIAIGHRSFKPLFAVGIPSAVGMASLIAANRWIYERWTLSGYANYTTDNLTDSSSWTIAQSALNVVGFFVAPERGLFVWTPLILILLPAAWRALRISPPWVIAFAAGGLVYTSVQLRINWFHGVDTFFGYRHGLELLTATTPLLAIAWARLASPATKGVASGLAVVQIPAMLVGALVPHGFLSVDQTWTDNSMLWLARQQPIFFAPVLALVAWLAVRAGRGVALDAQREPGDRSRA
jgi:hypothetical protein